jgi:hypothetical protein
VTLTREEVLDAIRTEGLNGYRWFEDATNETDVIAIQRTSDGWVVFATDERATPIGRREFSSEEPALENFLSRLRSLNSVAAWHAKNREAKAAERAATEAGAGAERATVPNVQTLPPGDGTAPSDSPRYFVRELRIDGQLVPARLFRRRTDATGTIDEYLVDVDTWAPDTRGVLDRAIRFSLDSDLEEISDEAAHDIFDMVATRTYVPLRRR